MLSRPPRRERLLSPRPCLRGRVALAVTLLAGPPTFLTISQATLHAQAKPAVHHTVDGTVLNTAKVPVGGAVVYLENPKSLDVQSYLSDAQGLFHFNQISPQTDYEVWAELNGVQSKHKFISQFSNKIHFHFALKLVPDKKKFLGIF